ncbi:MAG: HNH endonuclease [Phocaeicola sp.]
MKQKYSKTGKCIWCGLEEPEVHFNTEPHIIPSSLGGKEIGFDICDDCNHFFGKATQGSPSVNLAFKEVFNAFRIFGRNLDENTHKDLKSIFFEYWHKKRTIRIKRNFNAFSLTKQFKRGLYEVFLQKYHYETQNGNHPMFDVVRKYARNGIGNLRIYYAFNNIILVPTEESSLILPMNERILNNMMTSGIYHFFFLGHHFYLEVLPTAFNINGKKYLQSEANSILINAIGNEQIFEFTDITQVDFLMERFNNP